MRVIAGEAKGRRLFSVPGETTRPITDRVKSALFNILGARLVEASFLDLFAGTGGVGIEALSRGAAEATFVERDERALVTIRRNLSATGLADRARVVRSDVFKFIAAHQGQPFDIIYVAPPQYQGLWARTVLALDPSPLLVQGGLVVAQIFPKEYATLPLQRLVLSDQRKYGSTLLCFYRVG
jgi:16S rRNA (guanine966-N2)-methyltransferase